MLIEFRVNNYSSFRDETILDMTAAESVSDYPHHTVSCGNEHLLKTAAVYGANASGKTNLYRAFRCMRNYVLFSISFGGSLYQSGKRPELSPYLFSDHTKKSDTVFEIWYSDDKNKNIYNYGFSAGNNGISEEWLNVRLKTSSNYERIFYRNNGKTTEFGNNSAHEKSEWNIPITDCDYLERALNKETLLLSLGAKVKIPILERVFQWFEKLVFLDFGSLEENNNISSRLPDKFAEDSNVQNQVASYLSAFDTTIKGFRIDKITDASDNNSRKNGYRIWVKHPANDSDILVELPINRESAGMQKMFAMYDSLRFVLEHGGVLFIDELSDRLHPLLVRDFIQTFFSMERNPNNAQLIITIHDIIQLATDLFRRDEVWFVEKDNDGASHLYSLSDFPADKSTVYSPPENTVWYQYLLGKYGAIPDLKKIFIPVKNNDEKT